MENAPPGEGGVQIDGLWWGSYQRALITLAFKTVARSFEVHLDFHAIRIYSIRMDKNCKKCGKAFKIAPAHSAQSFCSTACYVASRFSASGKCKTCGKDAKTVFCSPDCRRDFWNKNGDAIHKQPRNWKARTEIIKHLGGKCSQCGFSDFRALDIHHVESSTKKQAKDHIWNWSRRIADWKKNVGNLELLCANCHRIHTWHQRGFGKGLKVHSFNMS